MDKNSVNASIGFVLGVIITFVLLTFASQAGFVLNWDIVIVLSLIMLIILYVLKRKYIDEYKISDSIDEGDFTIAEGDFFVDYDEAKKFYENDNVDLAECKNFAENEKSRHKDFILLISNHSSYYLYQAVNLAKSMNYCEADLADIYSLSKLNNGKLAYSVVESKNRRYMHSQGNMLFAITKRIKATILFESTYITDDFAVLFVKDREE